MTSALLTRRLKQLTNTSSAASVDVQSAGLFAEEGNSALSSTIEALRNLGIDARGHRSHRLLRMDVSSSSVLLAMTRDQKELLSSQSLGGSGKVFQLSELVGLRFDILDDDCARVGACYRLAMEIDSILERGLSSLLTTLQKLRKLA
jgi:protein-tyrosine phosphatase